MNHTRRIAALILALGIDLTFGDPPNRFHPVAWMGSLIRFFRSRRPRNQTRIVTSPILEHTRPLAGRLEVKK
jgi:cobalamin biosynthesis protein CobD/CbiB